MNFLLYRQNRRYLGYLSGICLAALFLLLLSGYTGSVRSKDLLLLREEQIVSSLLKEGVTPIQIAAACSNTEITEDGKTLLLQMGREEHMFLFYFPPVRFAAVYLFLQKTAAGVLFSAMILLGAVQYMRKLDHLYAKSAKLVERYAEGDFTEHLPAGDQQGTLFRLFASIDGLSRALRVQYEAEHASREFLKNTISDISHQLKTPLAALNLYTDIIAGEPDHPDTVRTFSEKSLQSLLRMEDLIQSLLKIVRLDAGSILFEKKNIPVRELVLRAAQCLQTRAEQEGKQILVDEDTQISVPCDPAWTAEAIENLIKNALDHTKRGGEIRVFWEASPVMVRLSVADNGCGILPEEIHHIFKRFYRSSRSSDRQGTGLGLPLARAIMEGQGGMLTAASVPGEGAVFFMDFM